MTTTIPRPYALIMYEKEYGKDTNSIHFLNEQEVKDRLKTVGYKLEDVPEVSPQELQEILSVEKSKEGRAFEFYKITTVTTTQEKEFSMIDENAAFQGETVEDMASWESLPTRHVGNMLSTKQNQVKFYGKQFKFEFSDPALRAIGNPESLDAFVDTKIGYIKFIPGKMLRLKRDYKRRNSITSSALCYLAQLPREGIFIENVQVTNNAIYVRVKDWPLIEEYG